LALVATVLGRGLLRRYPAFAALILFYPLRAITLLVLAGRISNDVYHPLFSVLAGAELLLKAFLMVELAIHGISELGGWTRRRTLVLIASLLCGCALAGLFLVLVPEPQSAGRMDVLWASLMVALFALLGKGLHSRNLRSIAAGLAAFAAILLISLAGKAHALLDRSQAQYLGWSYLPAVGYILIVIFWLLALRREPGPVATSPAPVLTGSS
jgi:hypothetical protein